VAFRDRADLMAAADELSMRAADDRQRANDMRAAASELRMQARQLRVRAAQLQGGGGGWRRGNAIPSVADRDVVL
jgi:hypothetical protein